MLKTMNKEKKENGGMSEMANMMTSVHQYKNQTGDIDWHLKEH